MRRKLRVLVAEDNPIDLQLLRQAITRDGISVDLHEVHDGEEVTHYLTGDGKFADRKKHPFPDLLLVDSAKPSDFKQFQTLMKTLVHYWSMCELPELPLNC